MPTIGQQHQLRKRLNQAFMDEQQSQLQKLNLSNHNLVEHNFENIPEDILALFSCAKHINLSHNPIGFIPQSILEFGQLTSLTLQHGKIGSVPNFLFELRNLRRCDLSHNELVSLPEIDQATLAARTAGRLAAAPLLSLNVGFNQLQDLPESLLQHLGCLKQLNAQNNQITTIPSRIFNLNHLAILILSRNGIATIPPQIGQLTELKVLVVDGNAIAQFPQQLSHCSKLKKLSANSSSIESFSADLLQTQTLPPDHPDACGKPHLSAFYSRDIHYNLNSTAAVVDQAAAIARSRNFPFERTTYQRLLNYAGAAVWKETGFHLADIFDYRRNQPNHDGDALVSGCLATMQQILLTKLQDTYQSAASAVSGQQPFAKAASLSEILKRLSHALANALIYPDRAQTVDLANCQLEKFPVELNLLGNLTTLNLRDNPLTTLPMMLTTLPNLRCLLLSTGWLSGLPVGFESCTTIDWSQSLVDSQPFFDELAAWGIAERADNNATDITKICAQLRHHYIHYQLQSAYAQRLLGEIENITNAGGCKPTMFPECYLDDRAKVLDLSNKHLVSIPSVVKYFTTLDHLNLANNQLTTLPSEITHSLPHLRKLDLRNNCIRDWPESLHCLKRLQYCDLRGGENTTAIPQPEIYQSIPSLYLLASWSDDDIVRVGASLSASMEPWVKFWDTLFKESCEAGFDEEELTISWQNSQIIIPVAVDATAAESEYFKAFEAKWSEPRERQLLGVVYWRGRYLTKNKLLRADSSETLRRAIVNCHQHFLSEDLNSNLYTDESKADCKKLDGSNLGLFILPEQIGTLHHLESLNLENNACIMLPREIGALRKLKHLNFSNERIWDHLKGNNSYIYINRDEQEVLCLPKELDLLALGALETLKTSPLNLDNYYRMFKLKEAQWFRKEHESQQRRKPKNALGKNNFYGAELALSTITLYHSFYRTAILDMILFFKYKITGVFKDDPYYRGITDMLHTGGDLKRKLAAYLGIDSEKTVTIDKRHTQSNILSALLRPDNVGVYRRNLLTQVLRTPVSAVELGLITAFYPSKTTSVYQGIANPVHFLSFWRTYRREFFAAQIGAPILTPEHLQGYKNYFTHASSIYDDTSPTKFTLNLAHFNLNSLPDSFHLFGLLKAIILDNNRLTELPASMENLKKLMCFSADANYFKKVPQQIVNLPQLKVVEMEDNNIRIVPEALVGNKKIRMINLSYNAIEGLPAAMSNSSSLKIADFSGNKILEIQPALRKKATKIGLNIADNCLIDHLPMGDAINQDNHQLYRRLLSHKMRRAATAAAILPKPEQTDPCLRDMADDILPHLHTEESMLQWLAMEMLYVERGQERRHFTTYITQAALRQNSSIPCGTKYVEKSSTANAQGCIAYWFAPVQVGNVEVGSDAYKKMPWRPPHIVAFRGTKPDAKVSSKGILADLDPEGIGKTAFNNAQVIESFTNWILKINESNEDSSRIRCIVTGHSLGGAHATRFLALWKKLWEGNREGSGPNLWKTIEAMTQDQWDRRLSEAEKTKMSLSYIKCVTFNAPGIDLATAQTFNPPSSLPESEQSKHPNKPNVLMFRHIEDLVHLAGEAHVPAKIVYISDLSRNLYDSLEHHSNLSGKEQNVEPQPSTPQEGKDQKVKPQRLTPQELLLQVEQMLEQNKVKEVFTGPRRNRHSRANALFQPWFLMDVCHAHLTPTFVLRELSLVQPTIESIFETHQALPAQASNFLSSRWLHKIISKCVGGEISLVCVISASYVRSVMLGASGFAMSYNNPVVAGLAVVAHLLTTTGIAVLDVVKDKQIKESWS